MLERAQAGPRAAALRQPSAAMADHGRTMLEAAQRLEAWGWSRGWRGSDPYDGLNARIPKVLLNSHWRLRQVLIQLVKRSPVDLRPLLGIRSEDDSASLAWVLSGLLATPLMDEQTQRARIEGVLARILELR